MKKSTRKHKSGLTPFLHLPFSNLAEKTDHHAG